MAVLTYIEENRNLLGCIVDPDVELVHTLDSDGVPRITAPDFARSWPDLMPEERKILSNITSPKEMSVELVDKWTDDHVACWGLRINSIGLGLWWYDDYIGREGEMSDPTHVFDHLVDIRTRENSLELLEA